MKSMEEFKENAQKIDEKIYEFLKTHPLFAVIK